MTCSCQSCVRLGYAQPRHFGDCEACGGGAGDTCTVRLTLDGFMPAQDFELCLDCSTDIAKAKESINERAFDAANDDGRCWRNYAE